MTEYSDIPPSVRLDRSLARLRSELLKRQAAWKPLQPQLSVAPEVVSPPYAQRTAQGAVGSDVRAEEAAPQHHTSALGQVILAIKNSWFSFRRSPS